MDDQQLLATDAEKAKIVVNGVGKPNSAFYWLSEEQH